MSKTLKSGASSFWVIVMTLGILGCLGGVAYTFYMIQQEAGQEGEYRLAADNLRLLSQEVTANARATVHGEESTFSDLKDNLGSFTMELGQIKSIGFSAEVKRIQEYWMPVVVSMRTLIDAGDRIAFLHSVSTELEQNIKPVQGDFATVVDILRDEQVSSETIVAAQPDKWLPQ